MLSQLTWGTVTRGIRDETFAAVSHVCFRAVILAEKPHIAVTLAYLVDAFNY